MRLPSGVETTVSIRDLARQPLAEQGECNLDETPHTLNSAPTVEPLHDPSTNRTSEVTDTEHETILPSEECSTSESPHRQQPVSTSSSSNHSPPETLRRSTRSMKAPKRMEDYVTT